MFPLVRLVRVFIRLPEVSRLEALEYRTWWGGITIKKYQSSRQV